MKSRPFETEATLIEAVMKTRLLGVMYRLSISGEKLHFLFFQICFHLFTPILFSHLNRLCGFLFCKKINKMYTTIMLR